MMSFGTTFRTLQSGLLALLLLLALTGCNPFRRSRQLPPAPPPPPAPPTSKQTAPEKRKGTEAIPPPPNVNAQESPIPAPPVETGIEPPPPPRATQKKRTRRRPQAPEAESNATAPSVQTPAPAPPSEPGLQLGTILSEGERAEYARVLDATLADVNQIVEGIKGKQMTGDQAAALQRVLSFAKQAEETRASDLVLAVRLAQRAQLLARDLAASIR